MPKAFRLEYVVSSLDTFRRLDKEVQKFLDYIEIDSKGPVLVESNTHRTHFYPKHNDGEITSLNTIKPLSITADSSKEYSFKSDEERREATITIGKHDYLVSFYREW